MYLVHKKYYVICCGGYEGFLFFMNLRKMCFLKIIQLKDIVNRFYKVKLMS